jgi:hypothetical protein
VTRLQAGNMPTGISSPNRTSLVAAGGVRRILWGSPGRARPVDSRALGRTKCDAAATMLAFGVAPNGGAALTWRDSVAIAANRPGASSLSLASRCEASSARRNTYDPCLRSK